MYATPKGSLLFRVLLLMRAAARVLVSVILVPKALVSFGQRLKRGALRTLPSKGGGGGER